MNNSYNYSHFSDLLIAEFVKEMELHKTEDYPQENTLSVDDQMNEDAFLYADAENK